MAGKLLVYSAEARKLLKEGIDTLSSVVKITLGPKGRNVILDKEFVTPEVCSDGVTIAKEIELLEPFSNMGVQLLKEAATKTNDAAGDGTTTSVVLAQAIITNGFKNVAAGADPMAIKRGIEAGVRQVVEELKNMSTSIDSKDQIAQVAALSAHEESIGKLISDAMDKVGRDGVVTVEDSRGMNDEIEYVEGMQIDRGYISPHFITNSEKMEVSIEDPFILICDKKISAVADVLPIVEKMIAAGKKDLVVIAEDVDGEALATLVVNKMRGMVNCLALKAPGFGDRRRSMLGDIAALTAGTVISEETGRNLASASLEDMGRARRVVATKDESTIVEGKGSDEEIKLRIDQLKAQIEETASDYDKEKLQERMAKLSGGVAVIKVGAATEMELIERKARVDDALSATRAAVEEGIVAGGGISLLRTQRALNGEGLSTDERIGLEIVRRSLEAPLRLIVENAGESGDVILNAVQEHSDDYGYDADACEFGQMLQKGIIDPVKVTRSALENAASVAAMVLTTESMITDIPDPVVRKLFED